MLENYIIDGKENVTIHNVWKVAHNKVKLVLGENLKDKIEKARAVIEKVIAEKEVVYGVSTGFGNFQNVFIEAKDVRALQANLIRSHCVGVGALYSREEVRASMFCRLLSNSQGHSGVRLELIEKIIELLNKNVIPAVPSMGSVGASGDLAPLSHFTLVLMGEGKVLHGNGTRDAKRALKEAHISPIILEAKEGLALNNGTSFMTGVSALNLVDAVELCKVADIAAALSLEACEGFRAAFDERAQNVRPHPGQAVTARNIINLLEESTIVDYNYQRISTDEEKDELKKVQDAYSLRCVPQVHGAVKDCVNHCIWVIETEINSVTDNPLIFPDTGDVISSGNFHGAPIGYVMDYLGIVLTDLGNISDRRSFKMLTGGLSSGLPTCLTNGGGLNSGLMITQYTAASLCGYNQVSAHPASTGTIPTSANQEDHVSFGSIAVNKSRDIVNNLRHILAIELLCAYQGSYFRHDIIRKHDKKTKIINGCGTKIMIDLIAESGVKRITNDDNYGEDMKKIHTLLKSGKVIQTILDAGIKLAIE